MLENIWILSVISLISFFPILLWGYLFTYLDENEFNRARFLIGIFSWALCVLPVLYLWDFIENTGYNFLNIFEKLHALSGWQSFFEIFGSLFLLWFLFAAIPFIFLSGWQKIRQDYKEFGKIIVIFSGLLWGMSLIFYMLYGVFTQFPSINVSFDSWLNFSHIAFNSLLLVIFYYLTIACLEELSKFFSFQFSQKFEITQITQWVLYAIFIALGFSFFENILYFYSMYQKMWLGKDLIVVYFSRNIFSLMLHVICSSILAYFFTKAYLEVKEKWNRTFIKIVAIGFFLSIFLHGLFNIFLTFDFTFIVFFYFIGGYFYLTSIFYHQ